jgi:uncharacterized membrane protein YfcA
VLESGLPLIVLPLFFLVAALYSSVGHGGASGYLALFALLGVASSASAPVALVLNVVAAGISFFNYYRAGYFPARLFLSFAITSIPAAFVGGLVHPSLRLYQIFLGGALVLASARMLFAGAIKPARTQNLPTNLWMFGGLIGCVLGFVSGMVGIGGGVFLSPLVLLAGWTDVKRTAGVSSAFIVVNSIAGIIGHYLRGNVQLSPFIPVIIAVFAGGTVGSILGSRMVNEQRLQKILGVVLLIAGLKLLLVG